MTKILYFSLIVLAAASIALGYFLGNIFPIQKVNISATPNMLVSSQIFDKQTASINATILGAVGNTITIQGKNNKTQSFKIGSNLLVNNPGVPRAASSTNTSTIKDIQINKKALINLELNGSEYEVISISYPINPGSLEDFNQATTSTSPN